MKVVDLMLQLDKLIEQGKGELEVIMSEDAEGNNFKSVDEVTESHCYEGEPVHPDDIGEEYDLEDLEEKIIIYPI